MDVNKVEIKFMPGITDEQLWEFYVRNDICEAGYGKTASVKALRYGNSHITAAFYEDKLVGIIRGLFDGQGMTIAECGLELALQGNELTHENGSLIEKDSYGIFKQMGLLLLDEMQKLGGTWADFILVEGLEETTFASLGMKHNTGHLPYYIDTRPYVQED